MADIHRRKRYIQSPISNYFTAAPPPSSEPLLFPTSNPGTISCIHPESIQSSLLNVGMRVRKAVPEGYKTITEQKPMPLEQEDRLLNLNPCTRPGASPAELVPFCGIHKIGGYNTQDRYDYDAGSFMSSRRDAVLASTYFNIADDDNDDAAFPSSQSSTTSTLSTDSAPLIHPVTLPVRGRKRAIPDDEDEEDEPNSALACATMASMSDVAHTSRDLATARSRANRNMHEVMLRPGKPLLTTNADFEEVDFLKFGEDEEEGMEVDSS